MGRSKIKVRRKRHRWSLKKNRRLERKQAVSAKAK
jgi:hypothetical protein